MGVKRDIPQIAALRERVEARFGKPLAVHADFLALVAEIEMLQRQHISESTLERVWGYSTRGYDTVSLRTLDVLSTYAAGCYWLQFCKAYDESASCESELFNTEHILTEDLKIGDRLRIGWLPNRMCIVRYLGEGRFVAEECHNSKMQAGDSFSCWRFRISAEAHLDNFCHEGDSESSRTYTIGFRNGLTTLQHLPK